MELKVVCGCGTKYKFDVEPVGGRMPVRITCPSCGVDGTDTANNLLTQHFPNPAPAIPVAMVAPAPRTISAAPPIAAAAPVAGGLRINATAPPAIAPVMSAPPLTAPGRIAPVKPLSTAPKAPSKDFNMGLGILGGFLGALLGAGLMIGFFEWTSFSFPLTGIGIGALSGYGARLLGRGTHSTMGIIVAVLAAIAIVGTFYFIYGGFAIFRIISIVICVGVAYRLASE